MENSNNIKNTTPRNVLVVDDDTSTESLWKIVLQSLVVHVRIDWATNANEAAVLLAEMTNKGIYYDLVIADIFLSGSGTGLDLWKTASPNQRERFVIVSAANKDLIKEHLKDTESPPLFLQKPLDLKQAINLVEEIFALSSAGNPPLNSNTLSEPGV